MYVSTPHPQHVEWVIKALECGKAVLCEKPLGINYAEVMAMVDAAAHSGTFLMEAFMYRCHPQTLRIQQLVRDGAIGEVRHIEASFGFQVPFDPTSRLFAAELGGGAILDVGCYPVSMARWLMGREPDRVTGHGRTVATGVDEYASALLEFPDGIAAQLSTGTSVWLENALRVYGTGGSIEARRPWHCNDADGRWAFTVDRADTDLEEVSGVAPSMYLLEADEVRASLRAGRCESEKMTWADSVGNARVLDLWRKTVGVTYPGESPEGRTRPLRGYLRTPSAVDAVIPSVPLSPLGTLVSRLVMGCDNQPNMSHAAAMWDHFFEHGGNAFDTAHIYSGGAAESLLGYWHSQRGIREQLVIVGKGAHTPQCYPDQVAVQLKQSLERLRTEYVDLYFLHRDNPDVPVGEFVDALNEQFVCGQINAIGASNWSLPRFREANEYALKNGLQPLTLLSNQFSLARMLEPVWPGAHSAGTLAWQRYLEDEQVALFPWSSQARGFFTPWVDAVRSGQSASRASITTMEPDAAELIRVWFSDDNFARRARADTLAQRHSVSAINVALAYVLAQPYPCFPLIGPRNLEESRSCLKSLAITLTHDERRWLEHGGGQSKGSDQTKLS